MIPGKNITGIISQLNFLYPFIFNLDAGLRDDGFHFIVGPFIRKVYLITKDQQFVHQRGLCAICEKPEVNKDAKGKIKWLSVDHNHVTGELRGLVCYRCNTALGKFGDSIVTLQSAIKYLEERGSYGE